MIWDMEYTDSVIPLSYLYIGLRRLVQKGIIIIIDNVIEVKLCKHVLIILHKNYEHLWSIATRYRKCGDSSTHRCDQQA